MIPSTVVLLRGADLLVPHSLQKAAAGGNSFLKIVWAVAIIVVLGWSQPVRGDVPVKIFFDTDMMTDCDDAGALAILHALANRGECEILATVVSCGDPWAVATVDAINRYYGRPELPIGMPRQGGVLKRSKFIQQIGSDFPNRFPPGTKIPAAVQIYREILEQQPDQSIIIVTVGYLTNLRDLLRLPSENGHRSGQDLIQQKVIKWVCMGGNFIGNPPRDDLKLGNVNFQRDPESAIEVIENWPGPIVFAGREVCSVPSGLEAGASLSKSPRSNPVRMAYEHYFGQPGQSRHVADLVTVLYAVRGLRDYWGISDTGSMQLAEDCSFTWTFTPGKNQQYLLKKQYNGQPNDALIEHTLESLLIQPPQPN